MRFQEMIETVDTHTGGEPTRIILSGIPKLEGNSVREKRDYFKEHYDYIRTRLTYEPRGHAGMLCAAVVPPTMPEADFGIFYMDDVQYLDMCGHASIGVGTALQEIGLVPKAHRDRYAIETRRVWCGSRTISRRTMCTAPPSATSTATSLKTNCGSTWMM